MTDPHLATDSITQTTADQSSAQPSPSQSQPQALSLTSLIARIVAVLFILVIGLAVSIKIKSTGPKPSRIQAELAIPTVRTHTVTMHKELIFSLHALGTVIPSSQVNISPRISGTIIKTGTFEPGQRYQRNDIIAELDPTDFKLAHTQRSADLASAETALKRELGQRRISAHEWERFQDKEQASDLERELIMRDPELHSAQSQVAAAQAALDLAQLHIDRCIIRAPFPCILMSKNVGIGSQVNPQSTICEVTATSPFWIRATIPSSSLQHIIADPDNGSTATLTLAGNSNGTQWSGRLIRILASVEMQGRLASLLIAVNKPLDGDTPLLLGSSVRVSLQSHVLKNVIPVSTAFLHNTDDHKSQYTLWCLNPDMTLSIKTVTLAWIEGDRAFISAGLNTGDHIITSPIPAAINGMKLRLPDTQTTAPAPTTIASEQKDVKK